MTKTITLLNNNPPFSGVGRYAYTLYQSLVKLGVEASFISWDKELFNLIYQSLRAFRLEWLYYLWKFKRLSAKLNINSPLVHITNAGYLASVIPKLRRHHAIIVTIHDTIPIYARDSLGRRMMGKALRNVLLADRCITVSETTKERLRFIDVDLKKVRVIYYGVDHELFKPRDKLEARRRLGLPMDRPIILNVGSEEPRKNIPTLLRSFKELLNNVPNALLMRVGERTVQMEKLIRNLDLSGKVLYRRASPDEVALYYNAADLLVHTAYYEGFGNPPLEAMASGLPVIASNRTSIPEVVGDGGILLDPFDVDGFAYWMREVLSNEDLRIKLSEKGYRRSMNFSWEKCARETLEVYREVLNEV
jgi:glycosyltransferase involved in cell wall biosynthesis